MSTAQETYFVLVRVYTGESTAVLHVLNGDRDMLVSLHATRELAEERECIERAFDNASILIERYGVMYTYRIEQRDAREVRELMAALDCRQAMTRMSYDEQVEAGLVDALNDRIVRMRG